jgi:hypothetical protein
MGDVGEFLGAESCQARLDRSETDQVFGVGGREAINRAAADVLPHHVHRSNGELGDECVEVFCGNGA